MPWRCWYDTDAVYAGSTFDEVKALPEDGLLVRMLYYEDGRQIQQGMQYYLAAEHHSGEVIYAANNDSPEENARRYPGCVILRGRWAPDDYYRRVVATALASTWP